MAPTTHRRTWGNDDSGCTILHVDMDSFFASVEILDDPSLSGRPLIVGGGERGVVTSATYDARACGVHAAMPIGRARRLCPTAVVLPGRHHRYREVSEEIMTIVRSITERVEVLSIDEAFLDVSGAQRRLGSPAHIAARLRSQIRQDVGVPASVGVASTKHVAKLATTYAKPDGLLVVSRDQTIAFLHQLDVGAMWGVGEVTRGVLEAKGVRTVQQLAHTPRDVLSRWIGPALAHRLHDLAWGRDVREVTVDRADKSVGTETTFRQDIAVRTELNRVVLAQSHECAARLRREGYETTRISIKVRFSDFRTITRSRVVVPTQTGAEIGDTARTLLDVVAIPDGGVRLIGVRAEGLVRADATGFQDMLLGTPARHQAEIAMDAVAEKFGRSSIRPGSLVENPPE
ncbi:MAG: DNA polymerase IV [Ruaniaceae bacterium]|nr:DNA polymerase IV [Ruaniaceae bacterium]